MLSLNSFKGLRFYYQLPLVLQASPFPNYQLNPIISSLTISQYLIYFFSLIYYRYIFSRHSHYYRPSRHSSIRYRPGYSVKSPISYVFTRCHLYIYLAFLYLRLSNTQYILTRYFLFFTFGALYILYQLSIYIIYANIQYTRCFRLTLSLSLSLSLNLYFRDLSVALLFTGTKTCLLFLQSINPFS